MKKEILRYEKKEKNVTKEILEFTKGLVANHYQDSNDLIEGIKEAAQYLRDNVEGKGLLAYVTEVISSPYVDQTERLIGYSMYEEVNKTSYEIKDDHLLGRARKLGLYAFTSGLSFFLEIIVGMYQIIKVKSICAGS